MFLFGFVMGVLVLLGYILHRMMRNNGWDDSNITNAVRLLSHCTLHAEDFGKMWYHNDSGEPEFRPFWYISEDEFEGVVKTRPPQREQLIQDREEH